MRAGERRPGKPMGYGVLVRVEVRSDDWIDRNTPKLTPQAPKTGEAQ
jgi:hypothetical protein